jgi:hypothetical protein
MSSVNVGGHGGAAQPSYAPPPAKPEPANSRGWAKFCGRCGHELKPGARFCGPCGHPVLTPDRGRLPPTSAPPPRPALPSTFRLPLILALAVLLLAGGTGTALLIRHFLSHPTTSSETIPSVPGTTLPPSPAAPPTQPTPPPTQVSPPSSDPWTVVQTFYNYVNEADYPDAWNLLSPGFQAAHNEGSYDNFVAGYEGHNNAQVSADSESGDTVYVTLTSPTSSWSASAWYQVDNGQIVAGQLTNNLA